jgi:hypothetical protein
MATAGGAAMDSSWAILVLSAFVFLGAIRFLKHMPGASDFRKVAGGLGILALAAAAAREGLRWHLLWFTPVAILAAYFYALRRLFALSHRVNKIAKSGMSDPEQIRRALQGEVDEYNRDAPEDQQMR